MKYCVRYSVFIALGSAIGSQDNVTEVSVEEYLTFLGFSNWENLVDTVVGTVPFLKYSLLLNSLGVYSLANSNGSVPISISACTTPLGFLNLEFLLNICFVNVFVIAFLALPPSVFVR